MLRHKCSWVVMLCLLVPAFANAGPLTNQIVPIAEYTDITGAFGLAYDPVAGKVWVKSTSGNLLIGIRAFNTFTPAELAGMGTGPNGKIVTPAFSAPMSTTAPFFGAQALGYNAATGKLVMHTGGTTLSQFSPGGLPSPYGTLGAAPGFLDGLDIEGTDFYTSPEGGTQHTHSQKNGANFLTTVAQRDAMGAWTGPGDQFVDRWSGIEFANGLIYAVSDMGGGGRTIGTYTALGTFFAIDPDGSPFASRLEDLAFDGRYLYGSDFAANKVFVFDIVGPGALIPEPATLVLCGLVGVGAIGYNRFRRFLSL